MPRLEKLDPAHGYTRQGQAVHARTQDHLPGDTGYERFNKRLALLLTDNVGTMTSFWLFCLISLSSLYSVLFAAGVVHLKFWLAANGFTLIVAWLSQNFIQLVLLPALMVGQNLQNEAADARAAKTFEDVEAARKLLATALDRLDCHTDGGLKTVLDAIESLRIQQSHA